MKNQLSLFATCSTGIEPLLMEELKELGIEARAGFRGVFIDNWDFQTVYTINYASRLASRLLLPLLPFKCRDKHSLYQAASEIDWLPFFKNCHSFAIDANVHHRNLRNSLFAAQVMKDAVCDQLRERVGRRPSIDLQNPDVQLNLYIQEQQGLISFDTSGLPLHKRGYRQEASEAPLQENLAAALLRLANYSVNEHVFYDPCAGSGTILIEAALMATHTPPGYLRKEWGFMRHPEYQESQWREVQSRLDAKRIPLPPNRLLGTDINKNAVRIAKINLRTAGFHKEIEVHSADFREFDLPVTPNFILTNPPYGRRMSEEESLRPLYRALGTLMKEKCAKPGYGFVFTGNLELGKEIGLAAKKRHVLSNGGIDSRLIEFDLY